MCGYELLIIHIIIIIVPITIICANKTAVDGSVRLYGGGDPAIGNVEVLYNGVWGAVWATGWNEDAERLVCVQLGYDPGSNYFDMGFAGR